SPRLRPSATSASRCHPTDGATPSSAT
ncbi:uncharacterized protein METZ01_LOCUS460417, partial [marine metagenome]